MIRLLVSVVLVAVAAGKLMGDADGLMNLAELEDLLFRDEQKQHYSAPTAGRTPDTLWTKFNSARRSPVNRGKLVAYLEELEQENHERTSGLSKEEIQRRILMIQEILDARQSCDSTSMYRTLDGKCNNLATAEQGAAGSILVRGVRNAYNDGLSEPRTMSTTGATLPTAREVSIGVFRTNRKKDMDLTTLGVHIAQITDHDLTAVHSQDVDCSGCSTEGECFPILLDASDPVFGSRSELCFAMKRAAFEEDAAGVRQHVNSITSFLDASFVYGSSDTEADELADDTGSMEHETDSVTGRQLLPHDTGLNGCAGVNEAAGIFCGKAGDGRAAEQPGLTALHTLFLREHNRIAQQLRTLDSTLSATDVYQKARKILGAEWQHISYNEYLPLITGKDLYTSKNLAPSATYAYDANTDASILNLFAAAAFRYGHTLVPFELDRVNANFRRAGIDKIQMNEAFFNASYIYDTSIKDGAVDSILRGMASQSATTVDNDFADALINNLFGDPDVVGDGFDLTALNIQRAREHGVPSYTTIRKDFCGLGEISSYQTLRNEDVMANGDIARLRNTYGDNGVQDIDAFVGFLLEKHLPNTIVGPTLACIFAEQFRRLKFGDRFFYKNTDQLTQAQIDEIEKATMARLMCDNVEAVTEIQPFVFGKAKSFIRRGNTGYESFFEYSMSGTWPHSRETVLDGLDNGLQACTSDNIPVVNLSVFI